MKPHGEQQRYIVALESLLLPQFIHSAPKGPFIVAIEGPNGAGKTTLCQALAESLGARSCLGTDDAWFSDAFRTRMIRDAEWFSSAMFFLSGCFERMRTLRDSPESLVILDRCIWSTLAVHAAENPERLGTLLAMLNPIAGQILVPALTLVLEADFATCQARIARKSGTARLLDELTAMPEFHDREQEFYRWLRRQQPEVLFLDANHAIPADVAARASAVIREKTGSRKGGRTGAAN